MEARFAAMEGDFESGVREEVAEELDILREELETAVTPADVAGSVAALEDQLGPVAEEGA